MIFVLDNYDSFTFNLVQAIGKLGTPVKVARNNEITASEMLEANPSGIVLSPGPGRPEYAGNMPQIFAAVYDKIPVLGVCLGHQMIGLHFGGHIIQAPELVHGKATRIFHDNKTIFRGLTDPFQGGRYHSLVIDPETISADLEVSARSQDGEIMGVRHRKYPIEGVQFHPESILTPEGDKLLANFVAQVNQRRKL